MVKWLNMTKLRYDRNFHANDMTINPKRSMVVLYTYLDFIFTRTHSVYRRNARFSCKNRIYT